MFTPLASPLEGLNFGDTLGYHERVPSVSGVVHNAPRAGASSLGARLGGLVRGNDPWTLVAISALPGIPRGCPRSLGLTKANRSGFL